MSENTTTTTPETFPLVDNTPAAEVPAADPETNAPPTDSGTNGKAAKGGKKGGKKGGAKPSKSAEDLAAKATAAAKAAKEKVQAERHHKAVSLGWKPEAAKPYLLPTRQDVENGKKYNPAEVLSFDKRLQMRALGKASTDDSVVDDYRKHMEDNLKANPGNKSAGFAPLKAVRVTDEDRDANGLFSNIVVFDGFHTGKAAVDAGLKSFPVEVMDGTYQFARLLALGSNAYRGLQRTDDDKKKAFYALIEDETMLADAVELARTGGSGREGGKGGLNRALAYVCGISTGSVTNYLAARGLTTRGDKIVKASAKPEGGSAPAGSQAEGGTVGDPAPRTTYDSTPQLSAAQLSAAQSVDLIEGIQRLQASMERSIGELMGRDDARDVLVAAAKVCDLPFVVTTRSENGEPVNSHSWPVMTSLTMLWDSVLASLQGMATKPDADAGQSAE